MFLSTFHIELLNMFSEKRTVNRVILAVNSTAHRVEKYIGKMSRHTVLIRRVLNTISLSNNGFQSLSSFGNILLKHPGYSSGIFNKVSQVIHCCRILIQFSHEIPGFRFGRIQHQISTTEKSPSDTFGF